MLEHTKKPHIEEVRFQVICDQANLKKITAALKPFKCTISPAKPAASAAPEPAKKQWLAIEDLFPEQKAGQALQAYRYRENLTQKQLAALVGINPANLSHMENGRRPVGKDMAKRLAKALNTDWRLLLS